MFCPNCGNKVEEGALFCGECGTKLTEQISEEVMTEYISPAQPEETYAQSAMQNQTQPYAQQVQNPQYGNGAMPGYGPQQPYGMQQPPQGMRPQPPKRTPMSAAAVVLLVELLAGVVLCIGLVLLINAQSDPKKVAEEYWKAMKAGNWSSAYDYCDFPEGTFMTKQMFINAMLTSEKETDYQSYTIRSGEDISGQLEDYLGEYSEYLSEYSSYLDNNKKGSEKKKDAAAIQQSFLIEYVPKGGSQKQYDYVTVSKMKEKRFLFWTKWKVSQSDCVVSDMRFSVPLNAELTINGEKIDSKLAETESDMQTYTIPYMFRGEYQVEVTREDMISYRCSYLVANGYDSFYLNSMVLSEEIQETLVKQLVSDTQALLQAAIDKKSFSEVESYFSKAAVKNGDVKNTYEKLTKIGGEEEKDGVINYSLTDFDAKVAGFEIREDGISARVEAEANYHMIYWYDYWYREPEQKESDGTEYLDVRYVKEGDEWKLENLPLDYYDF